MIPTNSDGINPGRCIFPAAADPNEPFPSELPDFGFSCRDSQCDNGNVISRMRFLSGLTIGVDFVLVDDETPPDEHTTGVAVNVEVVAAVVVVEVG